MDFLLLGCGLGAGAFYCSVGTLCAQNSVVAPSAQYVKMLHMNRLKIKITGESGAGLLSTGEIVTDALREMGFHVVADREYPSLIKGGHSCFIINASEEEIYGLSEETEAMLCIDKPSMEAYWEDLQKGGVFVHGYERLKGVRKMLEGLEKKRSRIVHLMAREVAFEMGGNVLMVNVVLVGMLWKALGLPFAPLRAAVKRKFADKPKWLPIDLKCVEAGYKRVEQAIPEEAWGKGTFHKKDKGPFAALPAWPRKKHKKILINGNKAVALGAVAAGVRAYFAYPMSPSSSILTYLSEWEQETGMVVKQCEDEITVANMTLGAMFAGTRSLCATSGGGYDLMTETVSLAGIIANPWVCVLCQRPGPGTGLPTWTGQGDLNLALYSSHGEFARVVMACSGPEDAFRMTGEALNMAEEYQVPVVLLSEKQICETLWTVEKFKEGQVPVKRGLVTGKELEKLENADRYRVTKSGVSKRWVPGASEAYYFANGDEHWEDGELTEEAEKAGAMYDKRVRKLETVAKAVPEPQLVGKSKAEVSFVGWGSSKNVMMDVVKASGGRVNYLHFEYLWPLKTKKLKKLFKDNKRVYLIEGNRTGQFGDLVRKETGLEFAGELLKWDGRQFYLEDVERFIKKKV